MNLIYDILSIIQLYFPMVTYCHCFILIFSISRAHYTWATGSWDWVTTPHIIDDKESSFVHSFKFWKFQEKNWMEGKLLGRNLFQSLLEFATNSTWKFWLNRKRPLETRVKKKRCGCQSYKVQAFLPFSESTRHRSPVTQIFASSGEYATRFKVSKLSL